MYRKSSLINANVSRLTGENLPTPLQELELQELELLELELKELELQEL